MDNTGINFRGEKLRRIYLRKENDFFSEWLLKKATENLFQTIIRKFLFTRFHIIHFLFSSQDSISAKDGGYYYLKSSWNWSLSIVKFCWQEKNCCTNNNKPLNKGYKNVYTFSNFRCVCYWHELSFDCAVES